MSEPNDPNDPKHDRPIDERMRDEDGPPEKVDVNAMHAPIMREKLEPRDGFEPIPIWLVTVFGALLFWGGWYLATYSGGWRSDVFDEDPEARRIVQASGPPKPVDPLVRGEKLFTGNCTSCHGVNGLGQPGVYPPLAGSEWVLEHPDRIRRILLHGLEGPVTVRGAMFNNAMPAFGVKLKDEQIAAVLTYVRHAWGNNAGPITPEEVAAARAETAGRDVPFSADELMGP